MNEEIQNEIPVEPELTEPDLISDRIKQVMRGPLVWLAILVVYVIYSRIWDLSVKVMHHDESLFAYYGYWLFRGNGYDYQPILHGPVLQFLSAFFFLLFGDDQWTMRMPSLIGGLLMFPVAWCWRRYIGGIWGVVAVTALLAFSPSIAFYTRFLRNDVPYLTATIWCALCLVRAMQTARPKYVWGAMMAAALMFCMMESSIFFFAACIGYLVTMCGVDMLVWRKSGDTFTSTPRWLQLSRLEGEQAATQKNKIPLTEIDMVLCMPIAAILTATCAWVFHRIFYATIHIYQPVKSLLKLDEFNVSAAAINWAIVVVFFLVVWGVSLLVLANYRRPSGRYGFLNWFSRVVWQNRWHLLAAVAIALIVYTTLFTTFFTNRSTASFDHQLRDFRGPEMVLTPVQIYRNTWDYWWDQHKLHRIKGPFHYYLPILLLYELPIICLVILGWIRAVRRTRSPWKHVAILASMHAVLGMVIFFISPIDWEMMDTKFHLNHPAHLFLILIFAQLLVYIAPMLYREGRRAESFITYWGVTSLFAYSYAGEKVPWLTIHTVGPFALLAACELVRLCQNARYLPIKRYIAVGTCIVAVLYQARNNHLLLFVHPSSPAERLVYNHTSPDIQKAVDMIHYVGQQTNFGNQLPIYMNGEVGWPMYWYLRDNNNITSPLGETAENTTRPIVMVDWDMGGTPNLRDNYTIRRMKVREWWEPEMLDLLSMTDIFLAFAPTESMRNGVAALRYHHCLNEWRKLWHYLAYREIWIDPNNPTWSNGDNEFAFCVRKDIDKTLMTYDWLAVTPKRPDVPVYIPY